MAAGLFMTASNNKKLRLMMEDTKTGFVLYTGFPKIQFVSRSTCLSQNGGVCSRSNNTIKNKSVLIERLKSTVTNKNIANKIIANKPVKPKLLGNMNTFIGANGVPLNTNASQTFFRKVEKFLPYFTDNEFDQVDKILVAIEKRTTQNNKKTTINRNLRAIRSSIRNARSNPFKNANRTNANRNVRTPNKTTDQRAAGSGGPNRGRGSRTRASPYGKP